MAHYCIGNPCPLCAPWRAEWMAPRLDAEAAAAADRYMKALVREHADGTDPKDLSVLGIDVATPGAKDFTVAQVFEANPTGDLRPIFSATAEGGHFQQFTPDLLRRLGRIGLPVGSAGEAPAPPPCCPRQRNHPGLGEHSLACGNRAEMSSDDTERHKPYELDRESYVHRAPVLPVPDTRPTYNEADEIQRIAADEGRSVWGAKGWRE